MEATVAHFRKRLENPWLVGPTSENLCARFEYYVSQFERPDGNNLEENGVLIAEDNPIEFLSAFLAAVALELPVFLANPNWGAREWGQLAEQIQPAFCLGTHQLPENLGPTQTASKEVLSGVIAIPTGGSSGQMKLALHSWKSLRAAVSGLQAFCNEESLNAFCILPLFHVSGLMQAVRSFITGGLLFLANPHSLLENKWPQLPQRPFHLSLVPTLLGRCLEKEGGIAWLKTFSLVFTGGAALARPLLNEARAAKVPVALAYGMTETAAMLAVQRPEAFWANSEIAGEILPHAEVSLKEGEIFIKSQSLCAGYLHMTADADRWLATGDQGALTPSGELKVTGRIDDLINSGGEKVNPREVENALLALPNMKAALVVAEKDPAWGERVVAICVTQRGALDEALCRKALKRELAPYKIPKRWILCDELPVNSRGKQDPHKLKQLLEAP